jgi:hypothetical protein
MPGCGPDALPCLAFPCLPFPHTRPVLGYFSVNPRGFPNWQAGSATPSEKRVGQQPDNRRDNGETQGTPQRTYTPHAGRRQGRECASALTERLEDRHRRHSWRHTKTPKREGRRECASARWLQSRQVICTHEHEQCEQLLAASASRARGTRDEDEERGPD